MDLPEGWANTSLGSISTRPQYGWTTPATSAATGLKLLRTSDISREAIDWSIVPYCKRLPSNAERYLLQSGDIVISRAGSVGISHVLGDCPPAVFASYLIRFRPLDNIPSEFIGLFLRSESYWAAVRDDSAGIVVDNINASKLAALELPLPPLAEQHRLVETIEKLLKRVSAASDRFAKVPAILRRFRQSVLAAACSGRLTEDWREFHRPLSAPGALIRRNTDLTETGSSKNQSPADVRNGIDDLVPGWDAAKLGDLLSVVTSGSRGWAKHYARTGPFFIRAQDINADRLILNNTAHVSPPPRAEGLRTRVQIWDILVTITGANVTKSALINTPIGEAYVSQHVALARPAMPEIARWLHLWIISEAYGRAQLLQSAYGAGKPGLNLDNIRELVVALPPLDEQREILNRVDSLFAMVEQLERRFTRGLARAESLTEAILAKAFRGELVPTEAELARVEGRSYETAEALLARIASDQTNGKPIGKRSSRTASPRTATR